MHNSKDEAKKNYEIGDLPKFFKKEPEDKSDLFSSEVVEISTIRLRSTKNKVKIL